MKEKAKEKVLKKMKESCNNKNYIYTNGDSDEQAEIRKRKGPPGSANK